MIQLFSMARATARATFFYPKSPPQKMLKSTYFVIKITRFALLCNIVKSLTKNGVFFKFFIKKVQKNLLFPLT